MKDSGATRSDQDVPSAFLRSALSEIPTIVGRLAYLASLRDPNTGHYRHHAMMEMFGEEATDQGLRASHHANFLEWLQLSLEEQEADLALYFAGLETDRRTVVATWLELESHRHLMPTGVTDAERRLYFTDLETLLKLLRDK